MNVVANEERTRAGELPTQELIAYIVRTYHEPLRHTLPDLQMLAMHAAYDHGRPAPVLHGAVTTATDLVDATLTYLDEYDREVFPVLAGRCPASLGFGRTLARVHALAHEVLRLVQRIQSAVSSLRKSLDATVLQRELAEFVDALAAKLCAQVELEVGALLPRVG